MGSVVSFSRTRRNVEQAKRTEYDDGATSTKSATNTTDGATTTNTSRSREEIANGTNLAPKNRNEVKH